MDTEITITLSNGKRRKLKSPDTLETIDGRRKAYFVMNNLQVYKGQTDGEVDKDGDFCLRTDRGATPGGVGIGLPFAQLIGWAYVNTKRAKK